MTISFGEYLVKDKDAKQELPFWVLPPGTTVQAALGRPAGEAISVEIAPEQINTLLVLPEIAIFDVLVQFSKDEVKTEAAEDPDPPLAERTVRPGSQVKKMPFLAKDDGVKDGVVQNPVQLCFAVPIPTGKTEFEGVLELHAKDAGGKQRRLRVALKAAKNQRIENLAIFFVPHSKPNLWGAWVRLKLVQKSDASKVVARALVSAELLRDNRKSGYEDIPRSVGWRSQTDGFVGPDAKRTVLALPIKWPVLFKARCAGSVFRSHMIRLESKDVKDNLEPVEAPDMPITRTSEVDFSTKKAMFDPGHGVVYEDKANRRSQEWFVAHRVARRVSELLIANTKWKSENVYHVRTAGLGLIAPDEIKEAKAPENGEKRFRLDLTTKKIKLASNSPSLTELSSLLLTSHKDDGTANAVSDADRTRLVTLNKATLDTICGRIDTKAGERVRPDSARWEDDDYVCTIERHPKVPGKPDVIEEKKHISIKKNDEFTVDDAMIGVLRRRSVLWSLESEIGGQSVAGFPDAARKAMKANGALAYMIDRVSDEIALESEANVTHGWDSTDRVKRFNKDPDCDLYISLHLNANAPGSSTGIGGALFVSHKAGGDAPPKEQLELSKIFLKYTDPLDLGTSGGGLLKTYGSVYLLNGNNDRRKKHVFFELAYMDSKSISDSTKFRYPEEAEARFVETTADQIVSGVIEALENPQDLDDVYYNGDIVSGGTKLW